MTVEAALLLPTFLTLLLLALQPVSLLYTRSVMESAAAETSRLLITSEGESAESIEAFALRRLAAVPDISIFHVGGPLAWDVGLEHDKEGAVAVTIAGSVKPLPVLGAFARAFGTTDAQGNVRMTVRVSYDAHAEWVEGSYETWTQRWN